MILGLAGALELEIKRGGRCLALPDHQAMTLPGWNAAAFRRPTGQLERCSTVTALLEP